MRHQREKKVEKKKGGAGLEKNLKKEKKGFKYVTQRGDQREKKVEKKKGKKKGWSRFGKKNEKGKKGVFKKKRKKE